MRASLPGIIIGLVIAALGVAFNQVPLVLLGVLVALAVVAVASMRATQAGRQNDRVDELSPDSRILVRPLKKIYQEMEEAAGGKSETISPYIATEALAESKRLLDQSVAALLLRDRLVRESRGRHEAQKSQDDLNARLASSISDDEKASLESALEARKQELGHYDVLKDGVTKIESSVKQAEAAMAEMRARLISSGSSGLAQQGSDPLREAVGRMQALSSSLSEAQEMLQK